MLIVNVGVRLQLVAVPNNLQPTLSKGFDEVSMGRYRIIQVRPKGKRLDADLLRRCMLGAISSAVASGPVLLSKDLSNVRCDRVDHGSKVWLVEAVLVGPLGNLMRIDQTVIA